MENVLYNHLRVLGYLVDVGIVESREMKDGKMSYSQREIDFIANKGSRKYYIQSAYSIPSEEKREQELASLLKISDSFKKIVVVNAYCHMRWGYEIATVGIAIYDDCIVIENAGRFPVRISPNALMQREEEDRKNTSMPPNPAIANVMYIGGLIEHWGRGLSMMARECERVGLPAPTFNQDGIIVKTTFVRPYDTSKDTAGVSKSKLGVSKQTDDVLPIKASLLKLIKAIGEDWYSSYDLCDILGYKSRNSFVRQHLNPAIDGGIIALEKPDKPNAPNQRYGLALKGKALYYERHEDKFDVENDPQKDPQNNFEGQIDPQNTADDPQKAAIFKAIKSNPSISRVELANTIGCSESTIKRRLKDT